MFSIPNAISVETSIDWIVPASSTTICPTGKSSMVVRQCLTLAAIISFALSKWENSDMAIQSVCAHLCSEIWCSEIWRNETTARYSRIKIRSTKLAQHYEKYVQLDLQRSSSDTDLRFRDKSANHYSAKAHLVVVANTQGKADVKTPYW